jgi:hypothetical protein
MHIGEAWLEVPQQWYDLGWSRARSVDALAMARYFSE